MPILLRPTEGEDLKQGDIIKIGRYFTTSVVPSPDSTEDNHGEANPRTIDFAVVSARDCVACRDALVSCLPVKKFSESLKDDDFLVLERFLRALRDGDKYPNLFYLGCVAQESPEARYVARLTEPFTLRLPTESSQRQQTVDRLRIASMDPDFIHHLHARVFNAVARRGFDDHDWMTTPDLERLVARGKADASRARSDATEAEYRVVAAPESGKDKARKTASKLAEKARSMETKLELFEQQLASRNAE